MYCIINCNFNLYTERNVFANNFFLSFLAPFFKIKKFIKKKNKKKIHRYMFLEHVDNFGKFLKFFVKKKKKRKRNTLVKKRGQNTLFLPLSQKCSSL